MKFKKIISISLMLMTIIYVVLTSCIAGGNTVYAAGNYISIEEADKMCPGVANLVNTLKNAHSNYEFQFYNTGIDWNEAIVREYQGHGFSPSTLFTPGSKYSGKWYCPICGTQKFDNGLCCASMEALKYMMDPRNSINEDSVFQFKSLETADVTNEDIARVVQGTFLNDPECISAIVEATQLHNINGFYLVAKMLTEHGSGGSTLSRGVGRNGVIYYNFFNIGASGNGAATIIERGTDYAVKSGWSSKKASILGGAEIVRRSYIGKGQNTCYYQKFNVVNEESGLFTHQYAQSILSAENEGRKFKSYYTVNNQVTGKHTFIIPLYTNMPAEKSSRPSTATKNTITYETAVVTAKIGLKVRSRTDVTSAHISSISKDSKVKVICRAANPNPNDGYYWDWIISEENGACGYVPRRYIAKTGSGTNSGEATDTEYIEPAPTPSPAPEVTPDTPEEPKDETNGEKMKMSGGNLQLSPATTEDEIKEKYPNAVITDLSGNVTNTICTGYNISIDGATYVLVKKGDINGDGEIDAVDYVIMLNHIKQTKLIEDEHKLEAAKVDCSEDISAIDYVKMLNYIKKINSDILIK